MDTATLLHLVSAYGYPVLFVFVLVASAGAPLPVSVLFIALGAVSARAGGPDFAFVAALGVLASVAGDLLDYGLGRAGASTFTRWLPWLRRLGSTNSHSRALRMWHGRGPGIMVLITRCLVTPLATPVSLIAGASRVRLVTFLIWDILGESLYILGNLGLGRFFGAQVDDENALVFTIAGVCILLLAVPLALPFARRAATRIFARDPHHPEHADYVDAPVEVGAAPQSIAVAASDDSENDLQHTFR